MSQVPSLQSRPRDKFQVFKIDQEPSSKSSIWFCGLVQIDKNKNHGANWENFIWMKNFLQIDSNRNHGAMFFHNQYDDENKLNLRKIFAKPYHAILSSKLVLSFFLSGCWHKILLIFLQKLRMKQMVYLSCKV